jgi:hypothetical protein
MHRFAYRGNRQSRHLGNFAPLTRCTGLRSSAPTPQPTETWALSGAASRIASFMELPGCGPSLVRTGLGSDFPVEQRRRRVPKTTRLRILFHPEKSLNALPASTKFLLTSPLMLILQRGRLVSRNPAFRSLATEGNPPPECRVVWRVLPRRLLCTIPVIHQRWRLFQL